MSPRRPKPRKRKPSATRKFAHKRTTLTRGREVTQIILDQFSLTDLREWDKFAKELDVFHWNHFTALEHQRSLIRDALLEALVTQTSRFEFDK